MENLQQYTLGQTGQLIEFDDSDDNRAIIDAMAGQATRSLRILTPDLEPALYDQEGFIRSVTALATRSRFAEILILVDDSDTAARRGHRLIEVARRFPSYIHLHRPCSEHRGFSNSFLLADERGYLNKNHARRYEGSADFNDPLKVRELGARFKEMWERSQPDSGLRRLHI